MLNRTFTTDGRETSEMVQYTWYVFIQCGKVKVKVNVDLYRPCREHTSKALRYGTRSQGISQFYLHTPCSSANGMNHTCLFLPRRSWYSFTDPEGWKAELILWCEKRR